MVQLKLVTAGAATPALLRFNSSMVQLKPGSNEFVDQCDESFNSSMVQLKHIRNLIPVAYKHVSIPLWYN